MTHNKDSFGCLFSAQLETVGEAGKEYKLNANELVRRCLPEIRQARKNNYTWETIANTLQEVAEKKYGGSIKIAAATAKRTYYKLTSKRKLRQKATKCESGQNRPPQPARLTEETSLAKEREITKPPLPKTSTSKGEEITSEAPTEEAKPKRQPRKQDKEKTRFNLPTHPGTKKVTVI
ncbi:MAG: hypothetical protein AAF202_10680 [Pseudomonadota bacterium]